MCRKKEWGRKKKRRHEEERRSAERKLLNARWVLNLNLLAYPSKAHRRRRLNGQFSALRNKPGVTKHLGITAKQKKKKRKERVHTRRQARSSCILAHFPLLLLLHQFGEARACQQNNNYKKKKKNGGSDNGKRGREKSMLINPTFLLNYLYCSSSTDGSTAILSFPSWCFFTICIYLYIYIYISLFCRFLNRQRGKIRAIIVRHRKTNTCATKTTTKKKEGKRKFENGKTLLKRRSTNRLGLLHHEL